jgi:undecaprenyl-diphosphatase
MGITVVVAVMAYVLARNASPRVQLTAALAVAATAIITGLGRMHVGVHWPSDVLGAWLWAAIWFLVLTAAFRAITSRRTAVPNGASGRMTTGQ